MTGRRRAQAAEGAAPAAEALADTRRRQILDAAEKCFRQRGFHSTSMAEIAASFGMSAGHIYNYFESKEAIIAGIVERDLAQFIERMAALREAADIGAAMLEGIGRGVADQLDPGRSALQLEVLAEGGRNAQVLQMVRAADERVRAELRELFRRALAGRPASRDLDGRVAVVMALFEGLLVRGLRQPDLNRAQLTRVLRGVIAELLR